MVPSPQSLTFRGTKGTHRVIPDIIFWDLPSWNGKPHKLYLEWTVRDLKLGLSKCEAQDHWDSSVTLLGSSRLSMISKWNVTNLRLAKAYIQ